MSLRCCRMSTSLYWHNYKRPSSSHTSLRTSDLEGLWVEASRSMLYQSPLLWAEGVCLWEVATTTRLHPWIHVCKCESAEWTQMAKKIGAARFPEIRHFQDAAWDIIIHLPRHKLMPVMFLQWRSNKTRLQPCSCSSQRRARNRWDGPGSSCLRTTS